jgi:hypothetical protein
VDLHPSKGIQRAVQSEPVAFHVEISSGFRQRARAFNLDEARMRGDILDPWLRGRRIVLGDKDWEPRDCKLIILEGPELSDTDLSMGRGWSNAEKGSENVTRRLIDTAGPGAGPVVAVLADVSTAEAEVAEMLQRLELETVPWSDLRARILGSTGSGDGPRYAAVLAIQSAEPPASWLFDAGLARGALGPRAVVAQLGSSGIPAQLTGVDVVRLVPGDESSIRALGDRLAG